MSLLLDALKKAAEQKAEKNRKELAQTRASDETVVDAAAEDASGLEDGSLQQSRRGLQDETEIDASDYSTRLERSLDGREDGTETRLDAPDPTETRPPAAQMQTDEDETIIFADDDVDDLMGEQQYVSREARASDDETDLSQLTHREDETEISRVAAGAYGDETDLSQLAPGEDETDVGQAAAEAYGEETDLSQLAQREDETDVGQAAHDADGDETDLSQLIAGEDETEVGETAAHADADDTDLSQLIGPEDQTDLSRLEAEAGTDDTELGQLVAHEDETGIGQQGPEADDTDFSRLLSREDETGIGGSGAAADETDISIPPRSVADLEHAEAQRAAAEQAGVSEAAEPAEDTTGGDEDMSLLLVERDQTNLTGPTSATDPQLLADQIHAMQDDAGGDEGLALVDTTRHRLPPDAGAGATQTSATTGVGQDTQTTRSATTRTETSTQTYAPDNYDRTLMRLPSDDASKLFAGMKADSDVVMTPEYAKKVFQSKSSAARMQQYKIYGGIGFVVLLVIIVFGLFEFQAEQDSIDNSLRPLKRDPMPGMIRAETGNQPSSLFAEVEVDEKTLSLIESAENGETDAAAGTQADEVDEGAAEVGGLTGDASVPVEQARAAASQADGSDVAAVDKPVQTVAAAAQTASAPAAPAAASRTATAASTTAAPDTSRVETASAAAVPGSAAGSSSSLRISSSQALEQKQVWLREAYAAYQAGNDEQALRLYNRVLDVDPGNRNALLARAAIHVQNNNAEAAIGDYQTLLLANPKDSLALTSLITVANYSPRETETQLKLMLRDDPDSPYLNFALANAFSAQNRWQEAQRYYFAALENNPNDPNYAYNLAVSLEHISQPRAAASYYRRALENMGKGLATFNKDVVDQRLEVLGKL